MEKEYVDPEIEEQPKEEEAKKPEEIEGEEGVQKPEKEVPCVSFAYDLKLEPGRRQ